jgi:hypothetical protein
MIQPSFDTLGHDGRRQDAEHCIDRWGLPTTKTPPPQWNGKLRHFDGVKANDSFYFLGYTVSCPGQGLIACHSVGSKLSKEGLNSGHSFRF